MGNLRIGCALWRTKRGVRPSFLHIMITTPIDPNVYETQGSVELLEVMPDPGTNVPLETAIVNAARV